MAPRCSEGWLCDYAHRLEITTWCKQAGMQAFWEPVVMLGMPPYCHVVFSDHYSTRNVHLYTKYAVLHRMYSSTQNVQFYIRFAVLHKMYGAKQNVQFYIKCTSLKKFWPMLQFLEHYYIHLLFPKMLKICFWPLAEMASVVPQWPELGQNQTYQKSARRRN